MIKDNYQINNMSVDLTQKSDEQGPQHRLESVYQKFQKAHQNMSNFKQLLTKFSTHKKQPEAHPQIQAFSISRPGQKQETYEIKINRSSSHPDSFNINTNNNNNKRLKNNGNMISDANHQNKIVFEEGWQYVGDVFQGKFHGYGMLTFEDKWVYSGEFKSDKMDGKGKLQFHEAFQEIVDVQWEWDKYEGEFQSGRVCGFGNLYLSNGLVAIGYWREGRPQYYTKVDRYSIMQ